MYSLDLSILNGCNWIELVCFHEWQLKGFVFRRWFHYMFFHTLDSRSQKSGLRAHRALKDTLRGNCFDSATNMSPSNVSFIRLCHQQSHRQWLEALSAGMRTTEIRSFGNSSGLWTKLRSSIYSLLYNLYRTFVSYKPGLCYSLALHFVAQQVLLCGCVVRMVWNHFIHMCGSKFVTCTCRNTETRCTLLPMLSLKLVAGGYPRTSWCQLFQLWKGGMAIVFDGGDMMSDSKLSWYWNLKSQNMPGSSKKDMMKRHAWNYMVCTTYKLAMNTNRFMAHLDPSSKVQNQIPGRRIPKRLSGDCGTSQEGCHCTGAERYQCCRVSFNFGEHPLKQRLEREDEHII